jgi:hypothetical protein
MERRPPFRFITRVINHPEFTRRTPRVALLVALACSLAGALAARAAPADAQVARKGLPRDTTPVRRLQTGTIDGFVGDTNLVPLQAAEVKVLSSNVKVGTGPNGRFRIEQVPVGPYVLIVRRAGYRPASVVIQVGAADTLRLSYSLERAVTSLEAAVITAERSSPRLAGFQARRKLGQGEFMTEADITKRNSVYSTELLRRFSSLNVGPSYTGSGGGGMAEYFALSKREGGNPLMGACPLMVIVDEVPMPTPFNLDLLPSPRNLAGIEVYNGASTIPPQYGGYNRGCGVILVWTKDGY